MTKEEYWFQLCNIRGLNPNSLVKLIERYQDAERILKAGQRELAGCDFLDDADRKRLLETSEKEFDHAAMEKLKEGGIRLIYYSHPDYPERFKVLDDKPPYFYIKGTLPDPACYSMGMVGARACSPYGKAASFGFAKKLAQNGVQIISGMATGIDAWASKGAIAAGGKTFVVLGTGIDIIYPLENFGLYYDILDSGGGIISEFPPGTQGFPWQFPHRNRLISALSDKLLILEAKKRSGTLTTAQHALAQGIDIYALPGKINDKLSEGCNRLIADGCGILLNVEDLLEDLYSKPVRCLPENRKKTPCSKVAFDSLTSANAQGKQKEAFLSDLLRDASAEAKRMFSCLDLEVKHGEMLMMESGLSPVCANTALAELKLLGLAEEIGKDHYVVKLDPDELITKNTIN